MKKFDLVDGLYWTGALLVSAGAALLCIPAGVMVLGGFCLAGAVLIDRGRGGTS